MADRSLELTIISAKGLTKVNLVGKMDVYAVAYLTGTVNQDQKQKTHVDKDGDSNPTWNYPMKFNINQSAAAQNRLTLVKIKTEGMFGDKDLGEVHVPIKELLEAAEAANSPAAGGKSLQFVSYQVRKPSGKPKGELNFSYKFGEKTDGFEQFGTAYRSGNPNLVDKLVTPNPAGITGNKIDNNINKIDEPVTAYPAGKPNHVDSFVTPNPAVTTVNKADEPVTAYPAPAAASGSGSPYPPPNAAPYGTTTGAAPAYPAYPPVGGPYPPVGGAYYPPPGGYPYQQQPGYGGYPPPPPPGYGGYPPHHGGYPPQPGYGYGYPPPVQQPQQGQKKSKFGLGLGAGLLGGALGGLLIGDIVSDAADGGGCGGGGCGGF